MPKATRFGQKEDAFRLANLVLFELQCRHDSQVPWLGNAGAKVSYGERDGSGAQGRRPSPHSLGPEDLHECRSL